MISKTFLGAAVLITSVVAISTGAEGQRAQVNPTSETRLPLCRQAEPGERCRTRSGEVRTRPGTPAAQPPAGSPNNLGGGDPGWEVRPDEFGGGDVGFATAPGEAGGPQAMECENCDDDEDLPQEPVDRTPRTDSGRTSSDEPAEEEDCTWTNPSQGPDQEFCDE